MKSFPTGPALLLGSLLALASASCSGTGYGDPGKKETFDADYGRTDLQTFASGSVASLKTSPRLARYGGDPAQPVKLYLGGIQNRTGEHLETAGIRDKIQTALVNSEQRQFAILADIAGRIEISEELRYQHESGNVAPEEARAIGRQLGAQVVLYGTLYSIEKKRGRSIESLGSKSKDVYYQFVLNAVDVESGEILWAHEQELTKRQRVSLFGGAG